MPNVTRILLVMLLTLACCCAAGARQPNMVFVITDDQRWDALGCMGHPFLRTPNLDRLAHEGAMFRNAFVTTSLCSPSRASFLTGTYAHTHGVIGNERNVVDPDFDRTPSFPMLLRDAGYTTAYIGKWHMEPHDRPRPGFDYWLSFRGQGVYNNPTLNENGQTIQREGYLTEILNEYAVNYLKQRRDDQPFCLIVSHKAVHDPRTPRPRDEQLYLNAELPKPANFDDDFRGKPKWQRALIVANQRKAETVDPDDVPEAIEPSKWNGRNKNRIDYFRLIAAVDEGVGQILATLEEQGQLDDTAIIFAGDNGYFLGEHRLGDKRLMYEESLRIPLLMRYPRLVSPGTRIEQMALNIDLAPTLLELAGGQIPPHMQGRSLVPLLRGDDVPWRQSFLYEYWIDLKPQIPRMAGVRTERWKLVRYPDIEDIDEMYDLESDPHELKNLATDPAHAAQREALIEELDRLMRETLYDDRLSG